MEATSPEFTAQARLIEGAAPTERIARLQQLIEEGRVEYPFILKPDAGQRGVGVKVIRSAEQAAAAEQGREQRRRFLTPGAGYQPGNAQMFYGNK